MEFECLYGEGGRRIERNNTKIKCENSKVYAAREEVESEIEEKEEAEIDARYSVLITVQTTILCEKSCSWFVGNLPKKASITGYTKFRTRCFRAVFPVTCFRSF